LVVVVVVVVAAKIDVVEKIFLPLHREEIEGASDFPAEEKIANEVQARRSHDLAPA